MIILRADNRQLLKNASYAFLDQNYSGGESELEVSSISGFSANDFVLFGEFGTEYSEIHQVDSVDTTNLTITLKSGQTLKFPQPESTRVYVIPYNQVKFYWTSTTTFDTNTQVGSTTNIATEDFYTKIGDTVHTTGYGWFVFFNSQTNASTVPSNPIPYEGFAPNSVKAILDSFYSLLSDQEQKSVTSDDAFRWLNEAYAVAQNELNQVNEEYNAVYPYTISITAGIAEYPLPANFGQLLSVTDSGNQPLGYLSVRSINDWANLTGFRSKYYLRNKMIGFVPTPSSDGSINIIYSSKSSSLTSFYDTIDLPNNNFYFLIDHMLYRAAIKTNRPSPTTYEIAFTSGLNAMKVTANQQNANNDSFTIDPSCNT